MFYLIEKQHAIPIVRDPVLGNGNHRFGISTDGVMRDDLTLGAHYANTADDDDAPAMGN